jgi:hypothetical protein
MRPSSTARPQAREASGEQAHSSRRPPNRPGGAIELMDHTLVELTKFTGDRI